MNHHVTATATIGTELTGVYETHLTVRDLDRSIAFYRDIIGLELARVLPERQVAFLWVGGPEQGMLGLWGTGTAPMGMRLHMAFRSTPAAMDGICDRLSDVACSPSISTAPPQKSQWFLAGCLRFRSISRILTATRSKS